MSSKSMLIILSYTVWKFARFLRHSVYLLTYLRHLSINISQSKRNYRWVQPASERVGDQSGGHTGAGPSVVTCPTSVAGRCWHRSALGERRAFAPPDIVRRRNDNEFPSVNVNTNALLSSQQHHFLAVSVTEPLTDWTKCPGSAVRSKLHYLDLLYNLYNDFGRVGSGHGSMCQTQRLTQFWF